MEEFDDIALYPVSGTIFSFFLIFLFERERESQRRGRRRGKASQVDTVLSVESNVGLDLKTPRSGLKLKPRNGHLNGAK